MDIYDICLNEIALEGLDGTTLSTLWLRLSQREEKILINITDNLKEVLWRFLQDSDVNFYHLPSPRDDPIIFNRFLGIDLETGKHVASAPDELEVLQDVYSVKPVNHAHIKGSSCDFHTRVDVSSEIKTQRLNLHAAQQRFGDTQLAIVASQEMRESALRGPCITPQAIKDLNETEYCVLERIGRSRWQGEIQTFLNNFVFNELKSAHIHYMMKALFRRGLISKQTYSYIREDKGGKVHQQVLVHLPHFRRECQSTADARTDMVCEILRQNESLSMPCSDLKQIIGIESRAFRKLVAKMVASGYVRMDGFGSRKNNKYVHKMMTLLKCPAEQKDKEAMEEDLEGELEYNESEALVAEQAIAIQGYKYIHQTGENGCSQGSLLRNLVGYGSLEARHICRKVEKAKVAKTVMIDRGRQRTQKYIAKQFSAGSSHTRQFLAEKKKMKMIMEAPDAGALSGESFSGEQTALSFCDSRSADGPSSDDTPLCAADDVAAPGSVSTPSDKDEGMADESKSSSDAIVIEDDEESAIGGAKWEGRQTTRKMRRANVVLSFVNEHKVVEGFFTLQKLLQAEEKDEGLTTKICKKTVKRLVQRMSHDGLLKHLTVPVSANECSTDVDFVMSLDCDATRFKTAVEQAQFRRYSEDSKRIAEQADVIDVTDKNNGPTSLFSTLSIADVIKVEDLKPVNKLQYGFQPKFVRTQVVHEYLWYLAYGHPYNGEVNLETLDYDKVKEYSKDRSWKRFLPPAPRYPDYGPGWLQVGDVAVLLPLCILCQYHQFPYMVEGLESRMNDSTQRNTLVRHLPMKMRSLLLHKRKYLFSLIQVIETLCFMGLASFNHQRKLHSVRARKETEMIYIHKSASILDTRKSEKHYNEVTPGLDYERILFKLKHFSDLEKYWMKLKDVCLMTALGVRINDDVDFEPGKRHSTMLKTFISKHMGRAEAAPKDDGHIPGDGKGAGGLDSSLFSHLYRNWCRTARCNKTVSGGKATAEPRGAATKSAPRRLPKLVPLDMNLQEKKARRLQNATSGECGVGEKREKVAVEVDGSAGGGKQDAHKENNYDVITVCNTGRNDKVKGGRGVKRRRAPAEPVVKKRRRRFHNKPKKPRTKYYDAIDLQALRSRKGKFRASFSPEEDEVLLTCKITSTLVNKKVRVKGKPDNQNAVSGAVIRDILHESCKRSIDKTSYSCLRRIRGLMKNRNAQIRHDVSVADLLGDGGDVIEEVFRGVDCTTALDDAVVIEKVYKDILSRVRAKLADTTSPPTAVMPDTVAELRKRYRLKVCTPAQGSRASRVVAEIATPYDVTLSVLENLMYATLSLREDEFSGYQAYKIFENYSEELISRVWNHVKDSGIICRKPDNYLSRQRHLPFAVPRFHLSKSHFQYLQSDAMWRVVEELLASYRDLRETNKLTCRLRSSCGSVVFMNMLLLSKTTSFNLTYPKHMYGRLQDAARLASFDPDSHDVAIPLGEIVDDVYDDTTPERTAKNELYKLYQKRRFSCCHEANNRSTFPLAVVEIAIPPPPAAPSPLSDVAAFLRVVCGEEDNGASASLESVKLRSDVVISVDEDEADVTTLADVASRHRALSDTLFRVVALVREAGVIGLPMLKLKSAVMRTSQVSADHFDDAVRALRHNEIIYIVGMYSHRAVLKKYAHKWFVTGKAFKGDRTLLRESIRRELDGTTKRHDGKHLTSYNPPGDSPTLRAYTRPSPEDDPADLPPHADDSDSGHQAPGGAPQRNSKTMLLDSTNYAPVKFLCRPWHNVSGETNHRTAKLLLSAVFCHVLWHPGVSLRSLTRHFVRIMQQIALMELLEKLVDCQCMQRVQPRASEPWQLFRPLRPEADEHVTTYDDDYYCVTPNGILRMAALCQELDLLKEKFEARPGSDDLTTPT